MTLDTRISKRTLLGGVGAAVFAGAASPLQAQETVYDVIVVGGGNAGMPTAIFAAKRGGKVLIIDAAGQLGGTLHLSSGQMSAAGTKLQKSMGIDDDTWQLHYDDVVKLSKGTVNKGILRLAVENNGETFDWLTDNGFEVHEGHPIVGTTHEPYSRRRYAWGLEGGISILKILEAQIKPHIESGAIKVLLATKATKLVTDASGAVVGVETMNEDKQAGSYRGRNVVLTAGGFASNPEVYLRVDGVPHYNDTSYPYSKGEGLMLGESVGGYARGGDLHTPLFGGILASDAYPSPMLQIFRPWPPARPPWEIYVNKMGERFVPEDVASHHPFEVEIKKQPEVKAWIVFDDAIIKKAPQILNPKNWDTKEYMAEFGNRPFFYKGKTLDELAAAAGLDAGGLKATVAAYNTAQKTGKDRFGRQYMPLPIGQAPFYAITVHGWGFTGYGGLAVDDQLRVIRKDGAAIGNLYAAGEIIGTSQTMGDSHAGGMNVTPALTFGRLLGSKMLKFET